MSHESLRFDFLIVYHESFYIDFGIFLLILKRCDELGEAWVLCGKATIPCLQCIIYTRFCEHKMKKTCLFFETGPLGNFKTLNVKKN